jgi:DNA-binding NtrC family response regulator
VKVLLLDDDPDLRDMLGEVIVDVCQSHCLLAASYDDLVALGPRVFGCQLAILDVNLGPGAPSGVDACQWLLDNGFAGRIVFLTGHARSHPAVKRASQVAAASVHQKPISLDTILSLMERAP